MQPLHPAGTRLAAYTLAAPDQRLQRRVLQHGVQPRAGELARAEGGRRRIKLPLSL